MTKDEALKIEKLELDIFRLQCCIWLLFVLSIMNSIKDLI
jgi:hypothetical protein